MYGAADVQLTPEAQTKLDQLENSVSIGDYEKLINKLLILIMYP